jgi:hypothetical protein
VPVDDLNQYMSTGMVWGGAADRVLLVVSRETGRSLPPRQVLYESLVLGLRYMRIGRGPPVRELWAFHVNVGDTDLKWARFHGTLLGRQAPGTEVEILIRGIDGLTTAQDGLFRLIQRHRHLKFKFKFTIIQRRCTIGPRFQPFLEPWFAFSPPAVTAAMRTLVFPTFTAQDYLAALALPFLLPRQRGSFFVRDLLLLWHNILQGMSNSDAAWYNNNRNSFV